MQKSIKFNDLPSRIPNIKNYVKFLIHLSYEESGHFLLRNPPNYVSLHATDIVTKTV